MSSDIWPYLRSTALRPGVRLRGTKKKKWKFELSEQLLNEMAREALAEAKAKADVAERALALARGPCP